MIAFPKRDTKFKNSRVEDSTMTIPVFLGSKNGGIVVAKNVDDFQLSAKRIGLITNLQIIY